MNRVDKVNFHWDELESNTKVNKYKIQLNIPSSVGFIDSSCLVLEDGPYTWKVPMHFVKNENGMVTFEAETFLDTKAVYRYFFEYYVQGKTYYINRYDTKSDILYDEKNKISVNFSVPNWAKDAVMYHIFVDRFHRSKDSVKEPMPRRQLHKNWNEDVVLGDNPNVVKHYAGEEVWNVDFFGGDLKGIEEKLDYIASLGVTILYLSPIVLSQSTHRYDANDYEKIDPYVGTYEDLKRLCDAAHKRGMKVILDAVFNHVGDESKYFDRYGEHRTGNPYEDGAFQNPKSKYHNMFRYTDSGDHTYWWRFSTLPVLNCDDPTWRQYVCGEGGIIDQWFALGIDGIRIDVADDLSDAALEEIHKAVVRNKADGFILGEVWDDAVRTNRTYITSGRSMHSYMNYQLVDALIRFFKYQDADRLNYTLRDIQAYHPTGSIHTAMNFTSTHDISRGMTLFGKKMFDPYHRFQQLEGDLQNKILESFWELDFSNEKVCRILEGQEEINFKTYHQLMAKLREKGVLEETVQYLMKSFFHTPFDPKEWAKDISEGIKDNLTYTQNYKLTPEEYQRAKEVYKSYLLFLTTYPGILSFFYGDEVGMEGLNNLANRGPFPWGREDQDLLSFVRSIGMFRKNHPELKESEFRLISLTPDFVISERCGDGNFLTVINNSDSPKKIEIPGEYRDKGKVLTLKKNKGNILEPHGGIVLRK